MITYTCGMGYCHMCSGCDCNCHVLERAETFDEWADALPTMDQGVGMQGKPGERTAPGDTLSVAQQRGVDVGNMPPMEIGLWDGDEFEQYVEVDGDPETYCTVWSTYDRVAYQTYVKRPPVELTGLQSTIFQEIYNNYQPIPGGYQITIPAMTWDYADIPVWLTHQINRVDGGKS